MIVTKTPLRVSFLGGGSDLPKYYTKKPAMVLSTTISRSIQIAVNSCDTNHCRVIYSTMEVEDSASKIKHDRVREILTYFNIESNIEICSFSDVSTKGTGLGSSSSFTVGLLKAICMLRGDAVSNKYLAELACHIEIDLCKEPIGKQDQYAAAYGGFNVIRFDSSGTEVERIDTTGDLNARLLCFSTGITRETSSILSEQNKALDQLKAIDTTTQMVEMAEQGLKYLKQNKLDDFGSLLHDSWMLKRSLASSISNYEIDIMYELARQAGALGGKILGAGGGGYMLLYVPESNIVKVKQVLQHYKQFDFRFSDEGSTGYTI
jgi:D-glycero-alpha-D-manno-heptose-7-phosphate kinase